MITAGLVKELREKTGAGMMDCKKALTAVDGDIEKAITLLREKGIASAGKKADRIAAEGAVATFISEDGKIGAIAEVNCETDFVAKNESFQAFVATVAQTVATNDGDVTAIIEPQTKELIANIGENIVARRCEKFVVDGAGYVSSYIHMGGKIGVMVQFGVQDAQVCDKEDFVVFAKDIAMHTAAAAPVYLTEEEVPADVIASEKEILMHQAINEGKPANIAEKMVAGRIQKMFKEQCLLDQIFVKNQDFTIQKYVEAKGKEFGTGICIKKFVRYQMGEGLEKKQENFAEEIAKQVNA